MNGLLGLNSPFDVPSVGAPTGLASLSGQQLEWAAAMDVRYWRMLHASCPSCGVEFEKCHPAMNLIPHWTGACVRTEKSPADSASTVEVP